MREALLYERLEAAYVRCHLCSHRCTIPAGRRGICQVRENHNGTLSTLVYGRTITQSADPVEKKPLFHFQPGSATYSLATAGCNVHCAFCQNWQISQMPREQDRILGSDATPEAIVASALQSGCSSIAYTYSEPTIFFEYAHDIARCAQQHGLANVLISNGYQTPETLQMLRSWLAAANIDLKAFSDHFYRRIIGARLQPVLDTLRFLKRCDIWLEVTTLIIPTLNDSDAELRAIARFICQELGSETPWHASRFYPTYKLTNIPPTPLATIQRARRIGMEEGLSYVYSGNAPGDAGEQTVCPHCGTLLLERHGVRLIASHLHDGCCPRCQIPIAGRGMHQPANR